MTSSCVVTPKQSTMATYDHKPADQPPPPPANGHLHSPYPSSYYSYHHHQQQPQIPPPHMTHPYPPSLSHSNPSPLPHPRHYRSGPIYPYYSSPLPPNNGQPSSPTSTTTALSTSSSLPGTHAHHSNHTLPPLTSSNNTRQPSPKSPSIPSSTPPLLQPAHSSVIASHPHRSRRPPVRTSTSRSIKEKRTFACQADDCGKVFKRSEHLKRHIRSIHTNEKRKCERCYQRRKGTNVDLFLFLAFECPYQQCQKRFSRSDNLNQHIRIHRHSSKESTTSWFDHSTTNPPIFTLFPWTYTSTMHFLSSFSSPLSLLV